MSEIRITGCVPGAIGWIVGWHGRYYDEHRGWGVRFETIVAAELAELMSRFDEHRDGFWMAWVDGQMVGSMVVDGRDADGEGARLRFFIVDPQYQGRGIGRRLMGEAMDFVRRAGFCRAYLTTVAGLKPARHLYLAHGFRLVHEQDDDHWGTVAREQKYVCEL